MLMQILKTLIQKKNELKKKYTVGIKKF